MPQSRSNDADPGEVETFLADSPVALDAFRRVQEALTPLGPTRLRLSATQVTWARRRGFAFLWLPGRWLGSQAAPAVLSLASTRPNASPRWKEVVEVRHGLWMHHLELTGVNDVDAEVVAWLADAWHAAS